MASSWTAAVPEMDQVVASVLSCAVVVLATLWVWQRKRTFQIFEKLGIPGPKPDFIWGNLSDINKRGIRVCTTEWQRKYGDIFGIFLGIKPMLCVVDAELLATIQIGEFSKFQDKDFFVEGLGVNDARIGLALEVLNGQQWKEMRAKLSPTFTTSKVRQMVPLVSGSAAELADRLGRLEGDLDIGEKISAAALEVAVRVFTGLQEPLQERPNSPLARAIRSVLSASFADTIIKLQLAFPAVTGFLRCGSILLSKVVHQEDSLKFLFDAGDSVYRARLDLKEAPKDILQILIDYNKEVAKSGDTSRQPLTDDEIVANVFTFVFGGYDTSSCLVRFTVHVLMHRQEVQERLRQEILENVGDKTPLDLEDLAKLKYMDQVVSEVLRLYTPVPTGVQRIPTQDYEINGKTIPKSVSVLVPLDALHRSESYWNNPNKFDPERFSPERKSEIPKMAYQPFGAGPRICIGMRMAQLVSKTFLVTLLRRFRILPCPQTDKEDLEVRDTMFILNPRRPVMARLEAI